MEHVKTDLTVFVAMEYPDVIPDDIDLKLAQSAYKCYRANSSPQVGDYVIIDGNYYRFSYDWHTAIQYSTGGSWHLSTKGFASFSGGLESPISKSRIKRTIETKNAIFWMWHHNHSGARQSVYVIMPVRVFKHKP